jgi:hypothetical protein
LTAGTCGLEGANFSGDTYARLFAGGTQLTASDDACGGLGSQLTYTAPTATTVTLKAGCYSTTSCDGTVAYTIGVSSASFSLTNTNTAQQNTLDRTVHLVAGDKLTVGTCGLPGALFAGDTFVRMSLGPTDLGFGFQSCDGQGSLMAIRAATTGDYSVRLGCFGAGSCSGNVVYRVTPPDAGSSSFGFTTSNTASATQGTSNLSLWLRAGDVITAGTCPSLPGAHGAGDTYIAMVPSAGFFGISNDDGCASSSLLSSFSGFSIQPNLAGAWELRAGCYAGTACSGELAYSNP